MTVKRVMGTETEYAVSLNTPDRYNPVQLSFDVVNGAADSHSKSIRWDYRQEDPVNDARGTRLERAAARPDMLTDAPQLNITNVIAPNAASMWTTPTPNTRRRKPPTRSKRSDTTTPETSSCRPPPNTPANRLALPLPCIATMWMARAPAGARTRTI